MKIIFNITFIIIQLVSLVKADTLVKIRLDKEETLWNSVNIGLYSMINCTLRKSLADGKTIYLNKCITNTELTRVEKRRCVFQFVSLKYYHCTQEITYKKEYEIITKNGSPIVVNVTTGEMSIDGEVVGTYYTSASQRSAARLAYSDGFKFNDNVSLVIDENDYTITID